MKWLEKLFKNNSAFLAELCVKIPINYQTKNPSGKGWVKGQIVASYCRNYKQIAVTAQGEKGTLWMTRGRCKLWSCPHCANANRYNWIRKITRACGLINRKYWWFVTLTASSKAHYDNTTLSNLQKAWKRLYDRIGRKFKAYRPVYVWVFEPHKTGRLHIHAIMSFNARSGGLKRGALDRWGNDIQVTRWFKDNMAKLGAGYQASCKPISRDIPLKKRAEYVGKYMTKTNQSPFVGLPRFRFVHTSQHFGNLDTPDDKDWFVWDGIHKDDLQRFPRIKDINRNKVLSEKDFEHSDIYPPELQ